MNRDIWLKANIKLVPLAVLFIASATIGSKFGNVRSGSFSHKFIALVAVLAFLVFAITFLHVLTNAIKKTIVSMRLGVGRASALQFIIRLFGYLTILLTALDHIGVPVGRILLGSAVLGIILGVAAQQALANFFASIVLIISHPFTVGENINLVSGALGGEHVGTVIDIGLTHTHIRKKDGSITALPNSTLLIGAAIELEKK